MLKLRVNPKAPPLMEHQKKSLAFKLKHPVSADFSQVGTGKTPPAALALQFRADRGDSKRILWVTTQTMKEETAKEFRKWTFLEPVVLSGSSDERREQLKTALSTKSNCFFITNYDSLHRLEKELIKLSFDSIVCDESSAVKNSRTQRSRSLYKIAKNSKFRLILTGTPVPNTVLDVFGQWKFLEPDYFHSLTDFKREYCVYVDRGFPILVGYKNLDKLNELLFKQAVLYKRDECFQLPERTFVTRHVPLSDDQLRKYKQLKEEFICEIENGKILSVNGVLAQIIKLSQITSGFLQLEDGTIEEIVPNAKLQELHDVLDECDIYNTKAIVWTCFLHTVDKLKEELKHLSPAIISGKVEGEDRSKELEKFRTDPQCRVLIAQQSISQGYTVNEASISIYFEHTYSWEHRDQSLGRNYRKGQQQKVVVYDLVCPRTVDVSKLKAVDAKKNIQEIVTDQSIEGVLDGLT